jgi:hypothetical protein
MTEKAEKPAVTEKPVTVPVEDVAPADPTPVYPSPVITRDEATGTITIQH